MPDVAHRPDSLHTGPPTMVPTVLAPAVFSCLLRALVLTSIAGYTFGQTVDRHGGPPLIDFLWGWGGVAVLLGLTSLTWLELALLQTWPRVGLSVTAFWTAAIVAAGCYAAVTDSAGWLMPTAVFALPTLVSLVRPASWQVPPRPWRRASAVRIAEMGIIHGVGVVGMLIIFTGALESAPALAVLLLFALTAAWLLGALSQLPSWHRQGPPAPSGLLVSPQVGIMLALLLFVTAAAGS